MTKFEMRNHHTDWMEMEPIKEVKELLLALDVNDGIQPTITLFGGTEWRIKQEANLLADLHEVILNVNLKEKPFPAFNAAEAVVDLLKERGLV